MCICRCKAVACRGLLKVGGGKMGGEGNRVAQSRWQCEKSGCRLTSETDFCLRAILCEELTATSPPRVTVSNPTVDSFHCTSVKRRPHPRVVLRNCDIAHGQTHFAGCSGFFYIYNFYCFEDHKLNSAQPHCIVSVTEASTI